MDGRVTSRDAAHGQAGDAGDQTALQFGYRLCLNRTIGRPDALDLGRLGPERHPLVGRLLDAAAADALLLEHEPLLDDQHLFEDRDSPDVPLLPGHSGGVSTGRPIGTRSTSISSRTSGTATSSSRVLTPFTRTRPRHRPSAYRPRPPRRRPGRPPPRPRPRRARPAERYRPSASATSRPAGTATVRPSSKSHRDRPVRAAARGRRPGQMDPTGPESRNTIRGAWRHIGVAPVRAAPCMRARIAEVTPRMSHAVRRGARRGAPTEPEPSCRTKPIPARIAGEPLRRPNPSVRLRFATVRARARRAAPDPHEAVRSRAQVIGGFVRRRARRVGSPRRRRRTNPSGRVSRSPRCGPAR